MEARISGFLALSSTFLRASLFFSVARFKALFEAGPDNRMGYALAGSAAGCAPAQASLKSRYTPSRRGCPRLYRHVRGCASLVESPIDLYKSQLQKQLIQSRAVRLPVAPYLSRRRLMH